jgi:hypothetical protein
MELKKNLPLNFPSSNLCTENSDSEAALLPANNKHYTLYMAHLSSHLFTLILRFTLILQINWISNVQACVMLYARLGMRLLNIQLCTVWLTRRLCAVFWASDFARFSSLGLCVVFFRPMDFARVLNVPTLRGFQAQTLRVCAISWIRANQVGGLTLHGISFERAYIVRKFIFGSYIACGIKCAFGLPYTWGCYQ